MNAEHGEENEQVKAHAYALELCLGGSPTSRFRGPQPPSAGPVSGLSPPKQNSRSPELKYETL